MSIGNISVQRRPILYGERNVNISINGGNSNTEILESTGLVVALHKSKELLKYLLFATVRIVNSSGETISSYDASASAMIIENNEETNVNLHIYKYSTNIADVNATFTLYRKYSPIYNLGVNRISVQFNRDNISDLSDGTYTFKIKFTAIPLYNELI